MSDTDVTLDENYFKIHQIINNKATQTFRQLFVTLWRDGGFNEWENNTKFGSKFTQGPGSLQYRKCQKIQKRLLETGNINTWDLPLLFDSIKSINDYTNSPHPQQDFDALKKIRNELSHLGKPIINEQDFNTYWQTSTQILTKFGLGLDEINDVADRITKLLSPPDDNITPNVAIALKFKEEGNLLYKQTKYSEAIKLYTKAIEIENIGSTDLGILYANRASALTELKLYSEAKIDAKCCINLRPNWARGYYRLGQCYEKEEKFDKALLNYQISLKFDADNVNCIEGKNYCIRMLTKLKREEHLDPLSIRPTLGEIKNKVGLAAYFAVADETGKSPFLAGSPHQICAEAHKYLHGMGGYPQNCEKAAEQFSRAASLGSAEGVLNLSLLTSEGKGVQRNSERAFQLLLEAAEKPPLHEYVPGIKLHTIGVREAQHGLGLAYQEGGIVPKNPQSAYEWYLKALRNGWGCSANNLGIMFYDRKHFRQDIRKAIGYWKVGALLGTVRAIDNLALHYFSYGSRSEAHDWFTYAMKHNTMHVSVRELFSEEVPNFCLDKFEDNLDQELLAGPMKEFVGVKDYQYDPVGFERRREARHKKLEISEPRGITGRDYSRKGTIIWHRQNLYDTRDTLKDGPVFPISIQGKLFPAKSPDIVGLKPISFKDMDKSSTDKIYEGFAIQVSIVEDAIMGWTSIHLLAEDQNGDLERVCVYNYPQIPKTHDELGYGCSFTVINPYLRLMNDKFWGIRIDDPNLIIKHPRMKVATRCRYCGKEGGTLKCTRCKRVYYCSKDCQLKDSTEVRHELVCFEKI